MMLTRRLILMAVSLLTLAGTAAAQTVDLRLNNRPQTRAIIPMPFSPRANPDPVSAMWLNPAGVGLDGSTGLMLTAANSAARELYADFDHWGLGLNLGRLAFGMETRDGAGAPDRRYTTAFAFDLADGFDIGAAYHWSDNLNRQNAWDLGLLVRPTRALSLGAQITDLGQVEVNGVTVDPTYHLSASLRPFGESLTLSADASLWSAGGNNYGENVDLRLLGQWQAMRGVTVHGGYAFDSETALAGVTLSFGGASLSSHHGSVADPAPGMAGDAGIGILRLSSHRGASLLGAETPGRIVHLELDGPVTEQPDARGFLVRPKSRTLYGLLNRFEQIRRDPAVHGVLLELGSGFRAGRADLEELRQELLRLREDGVQVVVWSHGYELGSYYLASAADRIYLYPTGMVSIPGLNLGSLYVRELLDSLHVRPEFFAIGEYKSAAEPLTRDEMSPEARKQLTAIAETWHRDWIESVAAGRAVSEQTAAAWVDSALHGAEKAMERGLVDALVYPDQLKKAVRQDFLAPNALLQPERVYRMNPYADDTWEDMTSPRIALVYAEGAIEMGESRRPLFGGDDVMGSETISGAIRRARENGRVAAIVLRVDSPGGWAQAADVIAREVERTVDPHEEDVRHIPLIVSMSDVAASGGYYISALADRIVAPRTSLTGSIGVVFGRLNVHDLLDTLGMHDDAVRVGRHAGLNGLKPWSAEEKRLIRGMMEQTYDDFTTVVSQGRGLSRQEVDEIGRGRVWTGGDAIKVGLVDVQGGLLRAISEAKRAAGLPLDREVALELYPRGFGTSLAEEMAVRLTGSLPEPLRRALRLQEAMDWSGGRLLMLAPVNRNDVVQP